MESVIGKAIDLVCEHTVDPVARQLKYVFCYKSCVVEMNDAISKLENEKEMIDREKSAAKNKGHLIYMKTDDWLDEAIKAQDEVSSLMKYEQKKAIMNGFILNPIARHKLGRNATKKKLAIEDLCEDRPQPDEIAYIPPPPSVISVDDEAAASASAAKQQTDGIFLWPRWREIMEEIMTALNDDGTNNVIGLYGMGGVGKSTMIKAIYDQVKSQGMFDEVVTVEVKVKPEIRRLQEEIAFQLGLKFDDESPPVRAERLRKRLLKTYDLQKKKTILVILDDLWEVLHLREVGIPLGGNDQVQIKLLLASTNEYLLSDKMGARELFHLNVLSDTDALGMFKFFLRVEAEGAEADIVTETARKCNGLPIVIEVTANALRNRALGDWHRILKRLDYVDVLDKLKVSYDYLPSKASKDLFLICGIIQGRRIQVRDLLKYTLGLQLFNWKDGSTLAAAAAAFEASLSDLVASTMLQKSDDRGYVNIHPDMRALALKIVNEDHTKWASYVTLSNTDFCKLHHSYDVSELEFLLLYCESDSLQFLDSFKDMKKLRVLELRNFQGILSLTSLTNQLDHLRNLGTLCFHECSLSDISTIGELTGLQILSFRGSKICKLPIQLRQLTALKILDLSDCNELEQIEPTVLGSFVKLEELNMENSFKDWEIDQEDDAPPRNARLIELNNMSRLSNVRIHIPSTSMLPKDDQLFLSKLSSYQIMLGDVCNWDIVDENESRVLMIKFDDSPDFLRRYWVQATFQKAEFLSFDGSLRYIVSSSGGSSLRNLRTLHREKLAKLCDGIPGHEETFSKLKATKDADCHKPTHPFDFFCTLKDFSSPLIAITEKNCGEIPASSFEDMKKLRDLEFRKCRGVLSLTSQTHQLDHLWNLGTLCFHECSLGDISIIGDLKVLQTLSFRGSDIRKLPIQLRQLTALKILDVSNCNQLEQIEPTVLGSLFKLEELNMENSFKDWGIDQEDDAPPRNARLIELNMSQLSNVRIRIPSASMLPKDDQLFLSKLSAYKIMLGDVCNWDIVDENDSRVLMIKFDDSPDFLRRYWVQATLQKAEFLLVDGSLQYIVSSSGGNSVRKLETLYSENLGQLAKLCDGIPGQEETFGNLKSSKVADCHKLTHLFDLSLLKDFSSVLKSITVKNCDEIECIVQSEEGDTIPTTILPTIESLHVSRCPKMRYMVSCSLPTEVAIFQLLKKIDISYCEEMEAIVEVVMSGIVNRDIQQAEATRDQDQPVARYSSLNETRILECRNFLF